MIDRIRLVKIKHRPPIIYHDSLADGVEYMGIGHSGGDVTVWAWVGDELKTWGDDKTHQDVLGDKKYAYWRGRFEGYTKTLSSVVVPASSWRLIDR